MVHFGMGGWGDGTNGAFKGYFFDWGMGIKGTKPFH